MPRFVSQINVGENIVKTYKAPVAVTDNDIGKPVKIGAADEVALCVDGDQIYGFIASVEPQTVDGKKLVGVTTAGRVKAILVGAAAVGTFVQSTTNTAAGTAKVGEYGLVEAHVVAATTTFLWLVISGTGLDGATVVLEKQ